MLIWFFLAIPVVIGLVTYAEARYGCKCVYCLQSDHASCVEEVQ